MQASGIRGHENIRRSFRALCFKTLEDCTRLTLNNLDLDSGLLSELLKQRIVALVVAITVNSEDLRGGRGRQ